MAGTAVRGRLTWQTATVKSLIDETAQVRTISLSVPDWAGHRAGQHVDVRLTAEDGYQAEREYSIASAPGEPVSITVERLEDGEVSPYLTEELRVGDELELRGPVGGEVQLTLRRGTEKPIDLTLKREAYKLRTVVGRVEAGNIGYLRIAGFDGGTQAALAAAVQDLRQKIGSRLSGFILDLRNNPGGVFDAAVAVADAFIDKGDIVVVKGRKPTSVRRISATVGDLANGLALVALVWHCARLRGKDPVRAAALVGPGPVQP